MVSKYLMRAGFMLSRRPVDTQHETAERLEVLRRADRYEQALGVKDQMLWVAMQASKVSTDPSAKTRAGCFYLQPGKGGSYWRPT